jgi:hypothetical protein
VSCIIRRHLGFGLRRPNSPGSGFRSPVIPIVIGIASAAYTATLRLLQAFSQAWEVFDQVCFAILQAYIATKQAYIVIKQTEIARNHAYIAMLQAGVVVKQSDISTKHG